MPTRKKSSEKKMYSCTQCHKFMLNMLSDEQDVYFTVMILKAFTKYNITFT